MIIAWQQYNRTLAAANNLVAHGRPSGDPEHPLRDTFFRHNHLLELEAGTVSGIHFPYVVCGPLDGMPVGVQPAMRKKIMATMLFMDHPGSLDVDALEQVQQRTYEVMMQFVSRYLHDYETLGSCGPFAKIDPTKMLFQEVGPTAQADYGWKLRLEFLEPAPEFSFDPSKWND